MKYIKLNPLLLLVILSTNLYSQEAVENESECLEKYGQHPKDFEGQLCWLKYALNGKIFVYENKNDADANTYSPISIPVEDINSHLIYNKGNDNFYLNERNTAWGGNWYSCRNGGIASRFHKDVPDYPNSSTLNWNNVKKMSEEELFLLSPAEKMDVFLGNSDFRITKFELQNRGPERENTSDDGFCGFCNGARIAGIILPEPKHGVKLWSNSSDITKQIKFSIGDIKAIASASYMHPSFTFSFGKPMESAGDNNPNPAIIDLMLRLYLSKHKIPFVIDASFGPSIFNESVLGYKRDIVNQRKLNTSESINFANASKAIEINLSLFLQDEIGFKTSESNTISIMGKKELALNKLDPAAVHNTWVYEKKVNYILYVDEQNKIVNGQWISQPIDFAWAAHGDGNEDNHIKTNDVPGIPTTSKNINLLWPQVIFIITKSLE